MPRCLDCGTELVYAGRGRPRTWCADCYKKKPHRNLPHVKHNARKRLCLDCGEQIAGPRAKRCWRCYSLTLLRAKREECKVVGCPRVVGEHGKAGYCCAHYMRKKQYGDPLYRPSPKPKKPKPRACRVNWSSCAVCSRRFINQHGAAKACPECRATSEWRRRWDKARRKEYCERTCLECETRFTPHSRTTIYCSKRCRDRQGRLRRRARQKDAYREHVWRSRIYERDGWKCKLCGLALARDKEVPHPQAPTIDHIVPLSCGGTHEPANVQSAHFICNSSKSAQGCGSQLLLVG